MSLPEFVNEPVLVETRLLAGGEVRPVAFAWRGRTRRITGTGRTWEEPVEGHTWRCFLVRTPGPETFELRLEADSGRWVLARAWLTPGQMV